MSMPLTRRIAAWFRGGFVPEPLGSMEWLFLRLSFAALVLWTMNDPHPFDFPGQPAPVGMARWINLSWLHRDGMFQIVLGITSALCLLYVVGRGLIVVLPLLTFLHVAVWTYSDSQGATHHGLQLVSMVLLAQTLTVFWKWRAAPEVLRANLWYYSRGMVLFSYVASALTKTIDTRGLWVWRSKYFPIELVKSWRMEYLDKFDPAYAGDPTAAFWLQQHPLVAQIVFGSGFFLELFAFLGLRDRAWSAFIGVLLVLMHFSIGWLMLLEFENHQWLALIFLINLPGWILLWRKNENTALPAPV